MAASELNRRGWHINEEKIATLTDGSKNSVENVVKKLLDIDLRDIGVQYLNEDINRGRVDYVEGPLVLQLQKLRVVSATKDNEDSQIAPKLCRLSLTDGHVTCSAVTLETIKGLGVNTPPGSKLQLSGTIEVETSFLLLTNKNTSLLGGRVEGLASTWELKKTLAQQSLTRTSARGEGGPPLFVPFGKKISNDPLPPPKKDNFKSLNNSKDKKTSEEDSEFQQQRQAALNEALQAKSSSGGVKTFGGGKVLVNDKDVATIAEMGFSAEEATSALKASSGSVNDALNILTGRQRYQRGGSRGGRGGRGDGRRRGKERDLEDDADISINTRPSGPATLFDFLETKIPTKDESKKPLRATENKSSSSANSSLPNQLKSTKDSGYSDDQQKKFDNSGSKVQSKPFSQSKGYNQNSQESYGGKGSQSDDHWNPQSLAPRFVKMGRGDNQKGRNEGSSSYGGGGAYENKLTTNQNRPLLKDNSQDTRNRGGSGYSNDSYDTRPSNFQPGNKYNNAQVEPRTYNDQRNSEYKRRTFNQAGDYARNNYGDSAGGKKNNYQSNNPGGPPFYDRNSAQSECSGNQSSVSRDSSGKSFKGQQPNSKPPYFRNQPGLMPTPYPHHQFTPIPVKQGYDSQQFAVHSFQYPMSDGYSPGVGDTCLAKYWEDNEYYPVVIDAISANGHTAVVTYLDFGNQEEVYYSDIQSLPQPQGWGYPMGPQMYMPGVDVSLSDPSSYQGPPAFVPPMEFTRGRRYDNNDRRKPTQPYYQPPNQKSH